MSTLTRPKARRFATSLAFLALAAAVSRLRARPVARPASLPARAVIQNWPATSRAAALAMIEKYGAPSRIDDRKLTWFNNGIWRTTIVYRDPVRLSGHPPSEPNVLRQTIAYRVPAGKLTELNCFSRRLDVDAAAGELSSIADDEAGNILALNLADELVAGKRSVADAQEFFYQTANLAASGKSSPYMETLRFRIGDSRRARRH